MAEVSRTLLYFGNIAEIIVTIISSTTFPNKLETHIIQGVLLTVVPLLVQAFNCPEIT